MKKDTAADLIPRPRGKFLRVRCNGCSNEQTVFSAASTKVRCIVCNQELAKTTGSKIVLKTKILAVFE